MPRGYDAGALIDELERLKLFAIEHSDDGATLVPAEFSSAMPGQPKAKQVTLGGKVSEDLAAQFRDAVSRNGINANALIGQFIADYVAAALANF
jgi:hypothetical protein